MLAGLHGRAVAVLLASTVLGMGAAVLISVVVAQGGLRAFEAASLPVAAVAVLVIVGVALASWVAESTGDALADVAAARTVHSVRMSLTERLLRAEPTEMTPGQVLNTVDGDSFQVGELKEVLNWPVMMVAYLLGSAVAVGVAHPLLGGMLASALCSMLLPALETLFKVTTDIRLLELSNFNAPLLRRLAVEAPGTYHHSLMVATLAEAAAEAIGANPLLARVGAYYHDIGKLLKPEYFVENQAYGGNKHEDLSPSMSCLIISSHVKDGLHFARSAGLPQRISDMIPQHHGTRIMTFFYQKAKEAADADRSKLSEADFRYPGPRPRSREAGIMMMADSVEAASRTLGEAPAPAQIRGMIDRLADSVIGDHQFDECDLTFRDVKLIKESFFKILAGIFHHRIEYPGYDFKRTGDGSGETAPEDPGPQQAKTG